MKRLLTTLTMMAAATPAFAVDKIYSPYVEKGEWELEYFGTRSIDGDGTKNNAQAHEVSLGYGVNDWWKTEVVGIWEKDPNDNTKFHATEWENIFQLTDKGEYWADAGLMLAYEWTPESSKADAIEAKLLLSKEYAKTYHILNLTLEKEIGSGPKNALEGGLAWSSRYRMNPYFQPGFELHSEFGELHDSGSIGDHEHYIGPAAYGIIPFEDEGGKIEGLNYRVGYLFGVSNPSSEGQVVLQLEYELEF